MEIRVLKYFLALAREENITRAAENLHITQPTLSRQLMQLEAELGVRLFIRGKSKITLTEDGMLLKRRAQEIVDLADQTERAFTAQHGQIEGELYIGSGETYSISILSDMIKDFHASYPLVKYNLYSGNADDIKERIDKGLLDIGLLIEPVDITKYDFIRVPHEEIWGTLIRKDSPLARLDVIRPTDLLGEKIILSKRMIVQNEIAHWCGDCYEKLNVIATYNLIYNASMLVESGLGVAICLEKLVQERESGNICFRPFSPQLITGTVLISKKNQVFSPVATKFMEYVKYALQA